MTQVTDEMFRVFYEGYRDAGPEQFSLSSYKVRNALKYLFDAKLISLPVDEAAIRESVVRECIAALPEFNKNDRSAAPYRYGVDACRVALQSLLPTKDRAEELAKEYWKQQLDYMPDREEIKDLVAAFRWLIEREGANG